MHIVVFKARRTEKHVGGAITKSAWPSKEEFDKVRADIETRKEIVAEGVTDEEAELFTLQTPEAVYLHYAIEECTDEEGNVNLEQLSMELSIKLHVIQMKRRKLAEAA
jgi:hypothetical protein